MASLTKLWQITIGHEKEFSKYVKVMCKDMCSDGDVIVNQLSYIIQCFNETPPSYEKNKFFRENEYANCVLKYVFEWFGDYIQGIDPNSKWAD